MHSWSYKVKWYEMPIAALQLFADSKLSKQQNIIDIDTKTIFIDYGLYDSSGIVTIDTVRTASISLLFLLRRRRLQLELTINMNES